MILVLPPYARHALYRKRAMKKVKVFSEIVQPKQQTIHDDLPKPAHQVG